MDLYCTLTSSRISLFLCNNSGSSAIFALRACAPPRSITAFDLSTSDWGKAEPEVSSSAAGKFSDAKMLNEGEGHTVSVKLLHYFPRDSTNSIIYTDLFIVWVASWSFDISPFTISPFRTSYAARAWCTITGTRLSNRSATQRYGVRALD